MKDFASPLVRGLKKSLLINEGKPGFEVFVVGFRQVKFGGPFGVETFVLSIDTRLFELKFIEDLNGFHLDKTAAGQPGNHNILSKLSMGPAAGPISVSQVSRRQTSEDADILCDKTAVH